MNCVICNSPMPYFGTDHENNTINRCNNCLLVQSTATDSKVYNDPEYFNDWGFKKDCDFDNFDEPAYSQTNEYLKLIKQFNGKLLLDVGTGNGLLPYLAKEQGYEAAGTDVSEYVCNILSSKFPVYCGTLETIDFSAKYDVITMFHVLEHTTNPVTTMQKCFDILNDNGYVIVVVPNYLSLDCRLKDIYSRIGVKKRPFKHLACGHHNFVFSLNNLKLLGEKVGFKVIRQNTFGAVWKKGLLENFLRKNHLSSWCLTVYQKV